MGALRSSLRHSNHRACHAVQGSSRELPGSGTARSVPGQQAAILKARYLPHTPNAAWQVRSSAEGTLSAYMARLPAHPPVVP